MEKSITTRTSPRKRKRGDLHVNDASKPPSINVPIEASAQASAMLETTGTPQEVYIRTNSETPVPEEKPKIPKASASTSKSKFAKLEATQGQGESRDNEQLTRKISPKKQKRIKKEDDVEANDQQSEDPQPQDKATKEEAEEGEADTMHRAPRTIGLNMFVGAHVSMAKGVENAVTASVRTGGNAFALFLQNQRRWANPALKDANRDAFIKACAENKYDAASHVLPHGSYLVNLAVKGEERADQAYKMFVEDLHRCEALGIKHYNFHPGTTNKEPRDESIKRISDNLNRALAETKYVIPLLENMAGRGTVIGSDFSDLRDIIAGIKPEFRSRIGICIDTCHAFAAGYDLRTPEAFRQTFEELDKIVGLRYLKAMHLNDSKAPFDSKQDLHQTIGTGFLGLRAFHNVMNEPRCQNMPLILETGGVYAQEIKLLESLIGMDPQGPTFLSLEKTLSDAGRHEREQMEARIAAKEEKANNKAKRALAKEQKTISEMMNGGGAKAKGGRKRKQQHVSSDNDSEASDNH